MILVKMLQVKMIAQVNWCHSGEICDVEKVRVD